MDKEKQEKKSSDMVPAREGPAWPARGGQTWIERDFDAMFNDFRRSVDEMMRPFATGTSGSSIPAMTSVGCGRKRSHGKLLHPKPAISCR